MKIVRDSIVTFIVVLAILATLFAIFTLFAPKAEADANSYLSHLANNDHAYFTGNAAAYLDLGHAICRDLVQGYPFRSVVAAVYVNPYFDFDYTAAEEVTYIARDYLC